MADRRFTKEEGQIHALSQTGEPVTIYQSSEWIETRTMGGVFVTKVGISYRLKNGEAVIRTGDTEFSCPSSDLHLRTEGLVEE
jgi:hypothetical protein